MTSQRVNDPFVELCAPFCRLWKRVRFSFTGAIVLGALLFVQGNSLAEEVPPDVAFSVSTPSPTPAPAVVPAGAAPSVTLETPKSGTAVESPSAPASAAFVDPWQVEFDLLPDSVRLRWKPIPKAIRYHVEMMPDRSHLRRLWIGTVEAPEALAPLHGFIPHGPVYVRIQAIGANAEVLDAADRSSLLGRQTDLPGGIKGISVSTQQAAPLAVSASSRPRRSFRWQSPTFSRDLTLVSGRFGRDSYNNYLASHGLDWSGENPDAHVNTGVRLQYTNNDREGISLQRGDMNLSTYLFVHSKKLPAHFSYSGYLYRPMVGGSSYNVNNFGAGYRVSPRLSTGAQFTPNPRHLSLWGSMEFHQGNLLFQWTNSDFSNALTVSYQTQQSLRPRR